MDKVKKIIELTCKQFEVTEEMFFSQSKRRHIVVARQTASKLIYENVALTLTRVGEFLGGQDHTTICHSIKTVRNLFDTDKQFRPFYSTLEEIVKKSIVNLPDPPLKEKPQKIKYVWQRPSKGQILFV